MYRCAYSLVELVVALAVIGVLSALVAPSLLASGGHHRLDAVEARLRADLGLARSAARASGAPAELVFDVGRDHYEIRSVTVSESVALHAGPYSVDILAVSTEPPGETCRIDGHGRVVVPLRLTIEARGIQRVLVLDESGVAVETP